jgi:hypothetical protein
MHRLNLRTIKIAEDAYHVTKTTVCVGIEEQEYII